MMSARGYGAVETKAAFERARELATDGEDYAERFSVNYGLWAGSFVRGELGPMRKLASAVLRDCASRPKSGEASIAQRMSGLTEWFAGEFVAARAHPEQALEIFDPERDGDLAVRFGQDVGVSAMAYSALALWALGEVDLARLRAEDMAARTAQIGHAAPAAYGLGHAALFELMRGDRARAAPNALKLVRLAREHDLPMFGAFGAFLDGWATAASTVIGSGLENMRRGAELLQKQNVLIFDGLLKIALAEAEAQAGDADRAVGILDEALATANRLGCRTFEPELHRARGEILLKLGPADPAPVEEAFPDRHRRLKSNNARAASNCARRSRSPNSTNRQAAPSKPTPSSRQRSKALRRRTKCRGSRRRSLYWRHWKPVRICDAAALSWHRQSRIKAFGAWFAQIAPMPIRLAGVPSTTTVRRFDPDDRLTSIRDVVKRLKCANSGRSQTVRRTGQVDRGRVKT